MDHQLVSKREKMLKNIAQELGIVYETSLSLLSPPNSPPSFKVPDDERKADAILGQLRLEEEQRKFQAKKRVSISFSKTPKPSIYSYDELYGALTRAIDDNVGAGVFEVLLSRFRNIQGNVNLARRSSTGMVRKMRNAETAEERGCLIHTATQNSRLDIVQLLAPSADEVSKDEALHIALGNRELGIIETLLQYGANSARYEVTFVNVASHGDAELLEILLRAKKKVSDNCITQSLLPAVIKGSLPTVMLLVLAGANGDVDNASALMQAIGADRDDLAAAIIMSKHGPSGPSIDRALGSIFSAPFTALDARFLLIEVLLCGGPVGNAASDGLFQATIHGNVKMMQLLLDHRVDINYNGASAVGHAIQRSQADLIAILLQDQVLKPELASELVRQIPQSAKPVDRIAVLSKLLVSGASGIHCSEQLITAAAQDDFETAQLLVLHERGDLDRPPVCSVDYNAARCLQIAVSRNNLPMVKLLALDGKPSKFSLGKAFSSIPPRISKDSHFILVQTLLRAEAEGPEVDAALLAAVTGQHKSIRLIELFVKHAERITDDVLIAAVSQGSCDILKILLTGNVAASTCAAAISTAMKLQNSKIRFNTVQNLIAHATTTGNEILEISQAVVEVLQNCPEELSLLSLLCREGKANVNFDNGHIVAQATKQSDPRVLDIVLHGAGSLPSAATIERALKCASELQHSDLAKRRKIESLLRRVKPQEGMNEALIKEIKSASSSTHDLSIIQVLLAAGADVNASEGAKEGAPVCWAVTRNISGVLDLILSRRPNPRSVSLAFPLAMTFQDPERYLLCEKLLLAGAVGEEVSKALYNVAREGPPALPLMKLLLPHADVNWKDGVSLRIVVQHAFFEGLDLLLAPRAVMPSSKTKIGAFQGAMKLKNLQDRHKVVEKLLKSGIGGQTASEALIAAVNVGDRQLTEILLKSGSGASVEYRGGHAVRSAASCGENEILKLLVNGQLCEKPTLSTLTGGFGGALTIKDKSMEKYYLIVQTLLEAGMRGEAIDGALAHAVAVGDSNLKASEMFCKHGASVEWNEGEAINIAAQSAFTQTLDLLLTKSPSENVLKRAYRSALDLPKDQRCQIIKKILKAGKIIDKRVTNTLTMATKESSSDRELISLLLSHDVFDEGESIVHAARSLDLNTLTVLVSSPKATACLSDAFKVVMTTDVLWQSSTGLAIIKLMLKNGASGDAVGEALYQAIEKCNSGAHALNNEFLEVLLEFGADVNYQRGLSLQRAAMQVNILMMEKLLPGANSESKAMAIPYLFTCCDDRATVLKAIQAFGRSFPVGDPGIDIAFRHPDSNLAPLLFMALDKFPRDTQILKELLDMGYHANQWQLCEDEDEPDLGMEAWPVLFWALERPEKRISSANIEMLVDAGANVNFKSKSGMTPLILAIQHQRPDIVAKLISKKADVSVPDPDKISPLALASRLGSTPIMELLLEAGAKSDDGSLHDAARELRCDSMRVLIKFGHQPDYPSDRHGGRSALAELCLKTVNCRPDPVKMEEAILCLVANKSDVRLSSPSEHGYGKTVLHYALDSSDPKSILPVLLEMMWNIINEDCFLFTNKSYTYSLTKYVEMGEYQGPSEQRDDILRLLRNKRAADKYYPNSIEMVGPLEWDMYCNPPKYIQEEVLHQKSRQQRRIEQREDVYNLLELKKITVVGEREIMDIQTDAEIARDRKKAQVDRELLTLKSNTQLRLEIDSERERDRIMVSRQFRDVNHQKAIGEAQISTQRRIRDEAMEEDRSRHVMQIEYFEKKVGIENDGVRARLAIEGSAMEDSDRILSKQNEREMARIRLQKSLVAKNMTLAGSLQSAGVPQRQIGYITGEESP